MLASLIIIIIIFFPMRLLVPTLSGCKEQGRYHACHRVMTIQLLINLFPRSPTMLQEWVKQQQRMTKKQLLSSQTSHSNWCWKSGPILMLHVGLQPGTNFTHWQSVALKVDLPGQFLALHPITTKV